MTHVPASTSLIATTSWWLWRSVRVDGGHGPD